MDIILPADFDGTFRFTNYSKQDFTAKWDNVEYTFPAMKTTPMTGINATPTEIQYIRKKFAKDFAIREFYETKKFKALNKTEPGGTPATYTDADLSEFIQKCLEPLEIGRVTAKLPEKKEIPLSRDENGEAVTKVLGGKESLIKDGSVMN